MKKLSLLFIFCVVSMLAFAQTDSGYGAVDHQESVQESQAGGAIVNPVNWLLGNVPKEFGYSQTFIVHNGLPLGGAGITISSVAITPSSGPFVVPSEGNGCPNNTTLQPGASCFITALFYATSLGRSSATLTVQTSAGNLQANMSARAVADDVKLDGLECTNVPSIHVVCYLATWSLQDEGTFTLTNNQQTSLTINSITPAPSSLFVLTSNTTCPSQGTVPANGSCTIQVSYTGSGGVNGQLAGTLTISDDAADQTPYYINLCHHPYCDKSAP